MISELFAKYESGAKQYISNTQLLRSLRLNIVCVHGLFVRIHLSGQIVQAIFNSIWLNSNGLKCIRHEW